MKTDSSLLIADGDEQLCSLYEMFLTECGYDVETASDGLDCLNKLRPVAPAVLILDMELRWGGGDGVLAWLRDESLTNEVSVILTATAAYSDDLAAIDAPPVVDYLLKPFAIDALLKSIRSAVANKERRKPLGAYRAPPCSEVFVG